MSPPSQTAPLPAEPDIHWPAVRGGYAVSLLVSLAAGVPLAVMLESMWWLALVSLAALLASGWGAGRRAGSSEPLNGAMLALLYFSTVAGGYLVGQALELLPDPLPGLPADDSTFFFVWPLGQLLAATLGALLGGRGPAAED